MRLSGTKNDEKRNILMKHNKCEISEFHMDTIGEDMDMDTSMELTTISQNFLKKLWQKNVKVNH